MKAIVEKSEIQKKLAAIQNVIERKSTITILGNFFLSVSKDKSEIAATDLETAIRGTIDLEVLEEGELSVPAKMFFEIVKELEGQIALESTDSHWLKIKSGKSVYRLACLPGREFPPWPFIGEDALRFTLSSEVLSEMIDRTIYASSSTGETDIRYTLNVLLFHFRIGNELTVVATDSHRLSMITEKIGTDSETERKILLSRKSLAELRRLMPEDPVEINIAVGTNHVQFAFPEYTLLTRVIEGSYPNYENVIPINSTKTLIADRMNFIKSLRRVSVINREKSGGIKVDFREGTIVMHAVSPDIGEATEEFDVSYTGEEMTTGFTPRFLIEAMNAMKTDEVKVELNESLNPAILSEKDNSNYICIVMPVRV